MMRHHVIPVPLDLHEPARPMRWRCFVCGRIWVGAPPGQHEMCDGRRIA